MTEEISAEEEGSRPTYHPNRGFDVIIVIRLRVRRMSIIHHVMRIKIQTSKKGTEIKMIAELL